MSRHAANIPEPLPLAHPNGQSLARGAHGILNAKDIKSLIAQKAVRAKTDLQEDQIQSASLDLRLGKGGYRLRASFLPGPRASVQRKAESLALHQFSLEGGAVLETGCVYLLEIAESLALPKSLSALASPKSSTGRIDLFARLITDYGGYFDRVPPGYEGPLYLEVSPRSFGVIARPGARLSQLRFRKGRPAYDNHRLQSLHKRDQLVQIASEGREESAVPPWQDAMRVPHIEQGLVLSVDLRGLPPRGLAAYRAKRHTPLIDLDKDRALAINPFWESLDAPPSGRLILDPDAFYILASREIVRIPPTHAAEMTPFDPQIGEFRVHYAGFFDPGFGANHGARAVLEVRSRDIPIVLEHGQAVGRLIFERLLEAAPAYDDRSGAHYKGQALALSKHFAE